MTGSEKMAGSAVTRPRSVPRHEHAVLLEALSISRSKKINKILLVFNHIFAARPPNVGVALLGAKDLVREGAEETVPVWLCLHILLPKRGEIG